MGLDLAHAVREQADRVCSLPAARRHRRNSDHANTEMSAVDLARRSLVAARKAAKKNGGRRKEKPRRQAPGGAARQPRPARARRGDRRDDDRAGWNAPAVCGDVIARFDSILDAAAPEWWVGPAIAVARERQTKALLSCR
ncbi:hypothetical protein [Streptomyces macrosporus]|uniref:Uncharacterized protein n=1 Tax=Streptomyces macrosporus TaxID=44032 RepID=A0ABP5XFP2_9ACTN